MSAFVWSQKEKGGKRSGKKSTNQILGLSSFSQTGVGGDNHITHPTSYGWGHFHDFSNQEFRKMDDLMIIFPKQKDRFFQNYR